MADRKMNVRRSLVTSVRIRPVSDIEAARDRVQFEAAVDALLRDRGFDPKLAALPELEMLEASTAITSKR